MSNRVFGRRVVPVQAALASSVQETRWRRWGSKGMLEEAIIQNRCREVVMPKFNSLVIALPVAAAFSFAVTPDAVAQKKLSYAQAFAQCKAEVNRTVPGDQQTARVSAGSGCMQKYGYRLKKKNKI